MSHEVEWSNVLVGSQVWVNQYAWLVEERAGTGFSLYSPVLDKRHQGSPKPWVKVTVLTPDDGRYLRDWSERLLDVTSEVDEEDGLLWREMLLVVRLGGVTLGERRDGEPWWCPAVADDPVSQLRLHMLYFHQIEVGSSPDDGLVIAHAQDHVARADNVAVEHTHGGRE